METELDELLDLENAGWRSLCDGAGSDFYGSIMTPAARMVLAGGTVMSRDEVIEALVDAPPWSSYAIDDPVIMPIANDSVLLTYTGTGRRDDGDDFTGIMSSTYVRDESGWKLAHYQQTPSTPR